MLDLEKVLWGINTFAGLAYGAVQIYDSIVNKNDNERALQYCADTLHNLGNQLQSYGDIYSQPRTSIADNSQVVPVIQPDVMPYTIFNPPVIVQQPQSYEDIYPQPRTSIVDNSQVVPVIQPDVMPPVPFNQPIMGQQPQPPIMPYCCQPAPPVFYPTQICGYQNCQPYYQW